MNQVQIKVQTIEEGIQAIEKNVDSQEVALRVWEAQQLDITIMEGGTVSGKSSLMLILKRGDGTGAMVQISEGMFRSLEAVFQGAVERFQDLQKARKKGR